MSIIKSLRNKLSSKTSPSTTIKPPKLVRDTNAKTITITLQCSDTNYDPGMAWFYPRAQLADTTIGYKLKNDPANLKVTFESTGKESDDFLQQLAAVSDIALPSDAQMVKSVALSFVNISTDDDITMLQNVYVVYVNTKVRMQIVFDLDDPSVALSFKEQDAGALVRILRAAY